MTPTGTGRPTGPVRPAAPSTLPRRAHRRRRSRRPILRASPDLTGRGRNSFTFLRWVMAAMVIIDHSYPLSGLAGGNDPTWSFSAGQDSLGGIAVAGFFLMSGFLVTRSRYASPGTIRFLVRRALRIFPGFWICLLATALVFAPVAWVHERGGLTSAFFRGPVGPLRYVYVNSLLHMHQYGIDGLMNNTPYGRVAGGAFDGSLWTLIYEFKCYLLVALLGITTLLWRRWSVVVLALGFYFLAVAFQVNGHWAKSLPGPFNDVFLARFGFLFMLGAVIAVYAERVILSDQLGFLAGATVLITLHWGYWIEIGYPALAYLLLWLAARLPMHWWDRGGDLSYGIYIYAFPVQMLLADFGLQHHGGMAAFILVSLAVTSVLAFVSWHLVEKPALALKNLPALRRRRDEERGTLSDADRSSTAATTVDGPTAVRATTR